MGREMVLYSPRYRQGRRSARQAGLHSASAYRNAMIGIGANNAPFLRRNLHRWGSWAHRQAARAAIAGAGFAVARRRYSQAEWDHYVGGPRPGNANNV